MKKLLAFAFATLTGLTGCAVYTPSGAIVVDPSLEVPAGRGGAFCPPGQAKKGRC